MGKNKRVMNMQRQPAPVSRPFVPSSTGLMLPIEAAQAQRIAELEAENAQLRAENERLHELRHETPAYMKADELQQMAVDHAVSWFNNRDLPYRRAVMTLASIEAFISGAVITHTSGLKSALNDTAGKFIGAYTEFDRRRREAGYTAPIPDTALAHIDNVYEGVQRVATGQDKGETLASLLAAEGAPVVRDMLEQLAPIDRGGRPGNSIYETTKVIRRLVKKRMNNPDFEGERDADTLRALIDELSPHRGQKTDKDKALCILEESSNPRQYIKRAKEWARAQRESDKLKRKQLR
jgi:hypothetical protein